MHISLIEIKNFRGLDIKIEGISDIVTIIGQNDSGKSNICAAILKVLDYTKRRMPLNETDSTLCNREDIMIKLKLEVDELTKEQLAKLHEVIHEKEGKKYVYMILKSTFNSDVLLYEDVLTIGDPEQDIIEYSTAKQNPVDKVLSVIYINPTYDTKSETKHFFEYKESKHIEKNTKLSDQFKKALETLGDNITNEEAFSDILNDINDLGEFEKMFEGIKFKLTPNIRSDNIYKSLEISTIDSNGNIINNVGDGKNKIFSMLLKEKTYDEDKKKIFIVEEPENHLYVLLQKFYIDSILSFKPSQMLITTHSPHVVNFEKTNQVIKIKREYDEADDEYRRKIYTYNINNDDFKKYGYLINVEIAEMMYYDRVLLIEGESEKYFYSTLISKDKEFMKYIFDNRVGIFSVGGIAFRSIKDLLESLGIIIYIKTDNDVCKTSAKEDKYIYSGITRCIKYLSLEKCEELKNIIGFDNLAPEVFEFTNKEIGITKIEEKMNDICEFFKSNNILLSRHKKGFEKDFLDYIGYDKDDYEDVMKYLKEAKLINLHKFILDNGIDIRMTEENKDSILLGFM